MDVEIRFVSPGDTERCRHSVLTPFISTIQTDGMSLMTDDKNSPKLRKKLASLEKRVALIEGLADLLRKYPSLASGTTLREMYGGVTLDLGRATIRPVWKDRLRLRLEWDRDAFDEEISLEERILCEDVMSVPEDEFWKLFRTVVEDDEAESGEDE